VADLRQRFSNGPLGTFEDAMNTGAQAGQQGSQQGFASPFPIDWSDTAKGVRQGVANWGSGILGIPGDLTKAGQYVSQASGQPTGNPQDAPDFAFDQAAGLSGPSAPLGSTEIKNAVNSLWGGDYQPNTLVGSMGKMAGRRLPTLLLRLLGL
jgi:hypothetical protein